MFYGESVQVKQAQNNSNESELEVRYIQTTRSVGEYIKICAIDPISNVMYSVLYVRVRGL